MANYFKEFPYFKKISYPNLNYLVKGNFMKNLTSLKVNKFTAIMVLNELKVNTIMFAIIELVKVIFSLVIMKVYAKELKLLITTKVINMIEVIME